MTRWFFVSAALVAGVLLAHRAVAQMTQTVTPAKVQYARDVLPILSANCLVCHGQDEKSRKAGLRLDDPKVATKVLKSGSRAIVPRDTKTSELIARIFADDSERMPPPSTQKHLKPAEKELLKRWIAEGAVYQRHWAFMAPQRPALPATKNISWARNPIDHFVLARLEKEGLTPAPQADRYTLARRAALDLTGLPPTLAMVDGFVSDKRSDAYDRYLDRLMALPAFGERWAQVWLDLARYADSNGYAEDQPRTIWKFRDWVIKAINANMPFDRFTIEQIAGDMLPNPTTDEIIATAFHRNTLTNTEGGTSDEEFRNIAVVDRVNTTFQVWMGITMGCAQCHSHKFDPITHDEYFQVFAIFNQSEDSDKADNRPNQLYFSPEQTKQKNALEAQLAELKKRLTKGLDAKDLQVKIKQAEANLKKIQPIATPIMRELPDGKKRVTKVHIRGDWLNLGKEVKPGIPALFPPLPNGMPANRLALAEWLVDKQNPLTSRVTVNRFWEHIFGVGLVQTPEDFGQRSPLPTHPELLDWLAVEFLSPTADPDGQVTPWDVKRLLKLLMTSATYRQSSQVNSALAERDPDNRLFARGPRFRSSAETIRDQALFVSGLLSAKMYGPSVRPPQPKSGLSAAFGPGTDWTDSTGTDKYRRGLYTYWRRTTPYPSMVTFDAPSRTVCSVIRPRTNTPLQALVTLNDPVFVEAAQALARRIVKEGGSRIETKVDYGFRLCLARAPSASETRRLADLFHKALQGFAGHPKEALALATEPLGPLPAGMEASELAAWTVVGNVLLNLDEMLVKR